MKIEEGKKNIITKMYDVDNIFDTFVLVEEDFSDITEEYNLLDPMKKGKGFKSLAKAIADDFSLKPRDIEKIVEEDWEERAWEILDDEGIEDEYIPSVLECMGFEGYVFDDISNVVEGNFGYGQVVDFGNAEYWFMDDDEADRAVREDLSNFIDDAGYESINGWERFIYITPTDRRIIAGEEADRYVEDMSDEDVLEEAGYDDEYEETEDEDLIYKAREDIRGEKYDEVYDALEDPVQYFVEDLGIYTESDLVEQSFINVDEDELIDYIIDSDGREHILARYDGIEHEGVKDIFYYKTN